MPDQVRHDDEKGDLMIARRLTATGLAVLAAMFWSAAGFPAGLALLILISEACGLTTLYAPPLAVGLSVAGFAYTFFLLRRWSR
jgi:hypothetical protein